MLFIPNMINIGADLGAMGDAVGLLIGGPRLLYVLLFGALCAALQIFVPYKSYVSVLRWLTLILFAYFGTMMVVKIPWAEFATGLLIPTFSSSGAFWTTVVAILGATISPYLFVWQASQEVEEIHKVAERKPLVKNPKQGKDAIKRIRLDTYVGMGISNLVGLAIIGTTAATLHANGLTDIETSSQAAEALRPVAGPLAFTIFTLGIVGTGLLAIPVLAGSAAYAVAEARMWPEGLWRKPLAAKGFYAAIATATAIGVVMNFSSINPIKALYWSQVINGIVAVPVMVLVMRVAADPKIMEKFAITGWLKFLGWGATGVMAAAVVGMGFASVI
jgi:Mn2+ and Fe2+ transporters of the NRAMP family